MKHLLFMLFIPLFFGCRKEVAKKQYNLVYTFNSGDVANSTCFIYEKDKKYENDDLPKFVYLGGNPDAIYLEVKGGNMALDHVVWYKTQEEKLVGITTTTLYLNNAQFASGQTISAIGQLSVEGAYTKKGRKFIVENGTFEFDWENAEAYGMTDQVLTGTWSLKRSE